MATSAVLDWASRSMMPSECSGAAPAAAGPRAPASPTTSRPSSASPAAPARCRTGAAGRSAWSGTAAARCPHSGAPGRDAARWPRAASAASCWGAGTWPCRSTTPGHQVRRDGAPGGVQRHAQTRQQQRDHLAGRGRRRVDPVDGAEAGVRGVVVDDDDGHPARTARHAPEHAADARQVAPVADHDEVVGRGRVGLLRGPGRCGA